MAQKDKLMFREKLITTEELSRYGPFSSLNEQALTLVSQQKSIWDLPGKNFNALNRVKTKSFDFRHFKILTQFNPERIRSSAAKTDAKSIAERPCFLCMNNLPTIQKGINFRDKYLILINPFPIFEKHLTIPSLRHEPQLILPYLEDLLDLSRSLNSFTVFYNGPKCGASAPDHFHFQAGIKGFLPIENELSDLEKDYAEVLLQNQKIKITAVENYLRRFIAISSDDKDVIIFQLRNIIDLLGSETNQEPMLNILSSYENGKWRVILFPRAKQRSSHFFETGDKQIIASPAAVELGGVLVLPREEDFNKITKSKLTEIYGEITLSKDGFNKLKNNLRNE
jgi:ATP adenylyltransferase/5',5'''-P-1,P-4-tetraphosphate phosphorylase II